MKIEAYGSRRDHSEEVQKFIVESVFVVVFDFFEYGVYITLLAVPNVLNPSHMIDADEVDREGGGVPAENGGDFFDVGSREIADSDHLEV